jgi:hypothetical protein
MECSGLLAFPDILMHDLGVYVPYLYAHTDRMKQDIQKAKLELIEWIVRQEKMERLESLFNAMRSTDQHEQDKSKLVGYRVKGQPVTKEMLIAAIQQSLAQITDGECVALNDLEKESEQW